MSYSPQSDFSVIDYTVFVAMLIGSLGIGVYHCFRCNKTTEDFLLASRSMSPVPVALSLIATLISSIAILGYVGEAYGHGIQITWMVPGAVVGIMIAAHVFTPVIYPLKLTSINEYLELRFRSSALKYCVLVLTCISWMLYLGICLYAPTLAMESVTPIKSNSYILILGITVTLYSAFGGLKAVVWTDALQSVVMLVGIIIATLSSIVTVGGFGNVWKIATEHGRTDALDFGFGLYTRHTVFNTFMAGVVYFTFMYSFNQSTLQRVSALPDCRTVKLVLHLTWMGLLCLSIILYGTGLSLFAVYADCDPISMGYISRKDHIFPYFIMEHLGFIKGVLRAFVACLISGTMSTVSSVLNAVPSMLWGDVRSQISFFINASEEIKMITNKAVTLCMGVMMMGLAFMASHMDGLIQASITLQSILSGPIIGVFLMGFCIPICGKKGAFAGFISSTVFMAWLGIGSLLYGMKTPMLPLSTAGCRNVSKTGIIDAITNTTEIELLDNSSESKPLSGFYEISYTFLSPIGLVTCISIGVLVSLATERRNSKRVDPAYLLPCCRKYAGLQCYTHQERNKTTAVTAVTSLTE